MKPMRSPAAIWNTFLHQGYRIQRVRGVAKAP